MTSCSSRGEFNAGVLLNLADLLRIAGEDNAVELNWLVQFGPKVKVRRKRGFGSLVIERNLARSLDAEVNLEFDPDGVHCRIAISASQVLAMR